MLGVKTRTGHRLRKSNITALFVPKHLQLLRRRTVNASSRCSTNERDWQLAKATWIWLASQGNYNRFWFYFSQASHQTVFLACNVARQASGTLTVRMKSHRKAACGANLERSSEATHWKSRCLFLCSTPPAYRRVFTRDINIMYHKTTQNMPAPEELQSCATAFCP